MNNSAFEKNVSAQSATDTVSADTERLDSVAADGGFSAEELRMIDEYANELDITDSTEVLCYGAGAQKRLADFSEGALEGVRVRDLGETGDMITQLTSSLRDIDTDERGIRGIFRRTRGRVVRMKTKYSKAEKSVDELTELLEQHQITLMKDISVLDELYDMNLEYMRELTLRIAAGKKRLEHEREVTLPALRETASASGLPEDAQAASDFADMCTRLERRLHDLELTRTIAVQTAPQIRLIQNNDAVMTEKLQSVIMNTVPLWKSRMVIALGIAHSSEAMRAQRAVNDMTNELLRSNAEALKSATVEVARESERGIADIETLSAANEALISTLDEVKKIQDDAVLRRREAEGELVRLENELREKLMEMSAPRAGSGANGKSSAD